MKHSTPLVLSGYALLAACAITADYSYKGDYTPEEWLEIEVAEQQTEIESLKQALRKATGLSTEEDLEMAALFAGIGICQ